MLRVKKTAATVLALSSSLAFAGTMGPVCVPEDVTVPCERSAWDVGVHALYLQPVFNGQGGQYVGQFVLPTSRTLADNEGGWGFGFKLEGSYHFNTGNDLNLNWSHLNDNTRTKAYGRNFFFFDFGVLPPTEYNAYTVSPEWDAVNLEFGQHVDFGKQFNIRFHGGAQYARIKNDISVVGTAQNLTHFNFYMPTKFDGFGPRVGADISYDLGKGIGIYANGAAAILAGTSKFTRTLTNNFQRTTTQASGSRTTLVPELEAKLGLSYNYPIGNGDLVIDGGYMWVNYLNALNTYTLDDMDFGVQGPYVGLKWIGTVA